MGRPVDAGSLVLAVWLAAFVPWRAEAQGGGPTSDGSASSEVTLGPSEILLREAVSAYANGDLAAAKRLFEEAHLVEPTARTLRGLGIVALREERSVEAVRLLRASLASSVRPLPPALRDGVASLLTEAEAQTATLSLTTTPPCDSLYEGGTPVARELDGHVLTSPGHHRYTCEAAGHSSQEVGVTLEAGRTTHVEVVLAELPASRTGASADPSPVAEPRAAAPAAKPSARRRRVLRALWGLVGSAGAFGVAAIVTGSIGRARVHDIERHCSANSDGQCASDELARLIETRHLQRLVALTNTWLGLAGASATGSIALAPFLLGGPKAGEAHAYGLRFTDTF
jgi:hypothetical protein